MEAVVAHTHSRVDKVETPIIACNDTPLPTSRIRRPATPQSRLQNQKTPRKGREEIKKGARLRSASAGRDAKSEMCSRYWTYLFENLERSISEIYEGCEKEENVRQCKEVILILQNYTRDFTKLVEWFQLKQDFEKTAPPMRPQALAWEIRKPSLCLLPHTRAYEQLIQLKDKNLDDVGLDVSTKGCTATPSVVTNSVTESSETKLVDIGLQTDLEEDPDIYYFAGGRIVAIQTDYTEEYGPLDPICFKSMPAILVLNTSSDSDVLDLENHSAVDTNMVSSTTSVKSESSGDAAANLINRPDYPSSNTVEEVNFRPTTPVETKSSATQLSVGVFKTEEGHLEAEKPVSETQQVTKPETSGKPEKISGGSSSVAAKTTFAEKAKNGMLRQSQGQSKSVSSSLNKVGVAAAQGTSGKSDAAKPSKPSLVSSLKDKSGTAGGSGRSVKRATVVAPVIPNYRSNIASRCRTAVNTGQIPEPAAKSAAKDKPNKSSSSPPVPLSAPLSKACLSSLSANNSAFVEPKKPEEKKPSSKGGGDGCNKEDPNLKEKLPSIITKEDDALQGSASATKLGITRSKSMINPTQSGSRKSDIKDSKVNSTSGVKKCGNPVFGTLKTSAGFKRIQSNSYISLPDETTFKKRSSTIDADGWETVKTRSNRAKWSSSNSSLGSSTPNQSRNSIDQGVAVKPSVVVQTCTSVATSTCGSGSTTTASTKTLSSGGGGEPCSSTSKVQNRSVKDKKSKPETQKPKSKLPEAVESQSKIEQTPLSGSIDGFKSAPEQLDDSSTGSAIDEEEIKRKDADLDDAMKEEEMLEEELRQVEKDFERIENDSTTEDGTTDNEPTTSPEVVDLDDEDLDDQYFFIRMDDQNQNTNVAELPPRETGRLLSLREKLMSPAKRCDGAATLKHIEAKLAKAERNREKLLQSKFNRYVELSDRFATLNETTKRLVEERAALIQKAEERRKRAAEKRQEHIKNIQRKAHDEDSKVKEIAFINNAEDKHKRHDYLACVQEIEERLQTMQEERRLKLEERASKASAVISRQVIIKKDWQAKLDTLQEKRRKTVERITREKEEKAKERSEMAREKARDREERLSALHAVKEAEKEELQKKIRLKQQETARRHEENMDQIRQKAIELGTPRVPEENATPSTYRVCTLCSLIIESGIHEMQHLRSKQHLDAVKRIEKSSTSTPGLSEDRGLTEGFGFKFIADIQADKMDNKIQHDKNRNKGLKKHSKKLMQKLMDSGQEFELLSKPDPNSDSNKPCPDPNLKTKVKRHILELERLVTLFENGKGSPSTAVSMDRIMTEIRKASVKNLFIKESILGMNGFDVAFKVLQCQATDLPSRVKVHAADMLHGFIIGSLMNSLYVLRGTGICSLMNLCSSRWNNLVPDDNQYFSSPPGTVSHAPYDPLLQSILGLLFAVLELIPDPFKGIAKKGTFLTLKEVEDIKQRTYDVIGFLVASGMVDRISVFCSGIRGPVDHLPYIGSFLQMVIDFLILLVYTLQFCWGGKPDACLLHKKEPDGTQLLAALEASVLAGTLSMSYSLLLHQGAPTRPRSTDGGQQSVEPPCFGDLTAEVVKSSLCLINAMARLDLLAVQNVLSSEAVSLQFRHLAGQLLWQVVPYRQKPVMRRLLTELIISIGNFTVGNKHNQAVIQSGQTPTVLQLLCSLPDEYMKDPKFKQNYIPTLLAAVEGCPENKEILATNNVDFKILEEYLQTDGKNNAFVQRVLFVTSQACHSQKGHGKKGKTQNKNCPNKPKPLEENNVIH